MTEDEFLALVEAAADLDDLLTGRFFLPRTDLQRRLRRARTRRLAGSAGAAADRAYGAFQNWIQNEAVAARLKLRNREKLPAWARELRRMIFQLPSVELGDRARLVNRIVAPAIAYAREQVRRKLRRAQLLELPAGVRRSLERELRATLLRVLEQSLPAHLHAFERAHRSLFPAARRLPRAQLERRFIAPGARTRLRSLLKASPAQARLFSQLIKNWTVKVCELTARLEEDRSAIDRTFFGGREAGILRAVRLGMSDRHQAGRETILLRFQNGSLIYKPRSGRSEADWYALLRWSESRGFAPSFLMPRLLHRMDYCWMEYVEALPCRNRSEARRFHRRAGALICVASLVRAVDCHRDNLIASRDQPVLVDAETLFHPDAKLTPDESECPVLRTGLLPAPRYASRSGQSISAFGGTVGGRHSPRLNGRRLSVACFRADLLHGARDMWNIIGERKTQSGAAFRQWTRRLTRKPWRRIYLPTVSYLDVCERSLRPHILGLGLKRSRAIARDLFRPGVSLEIALREISATACLDVPYFLELPGFDPDLSGHLPPAKFLATLAAALPEP
jgi:hypothetical protein